MSKSLLEQLLIAAGIKKERIVLSKRQLDIEQILGYIQIYFPLDVREVYAKRWQLILDKLYELEDVVVDDKRKKPKITPEEFIDTNYAVIVKHGWGPSFRPDSTYAQKASFHYVNEEGEPSTNVIALDASLGIVLTAKTGKKGRHWISVLGINISPDGETIEVDQIQGAEKIKLAGYKVGVMTERSPEVFGKRSPEHVLSYLLIDFAKRIGAKRIRVRDPKHNKWGAVYDESRTKGTNIYEKILHDVFNIRTLKSGDTKKDRPVFHEIEL